MSSRYEVKGFVWVSWGRLFGLVPRDGGHQPHRVIVPPVGIKSMNVLRPSTCGRFGSDRHLSSDDPLPQKMDTIAESGRQERSTLVSKNQVLVSRDTILRHERGR